MSKAMRFQNSFLMFVSLALAIVLWLHVQSQNTPTKTRTIWNPDVVTDSLDTIHYDLISCRPQGITVSYTGDDPSKVANIKVRATVDLSHPQLGVK